MAAKKRGLGKGLNALIGTPPTVPAPTENGGGSYSGDEPLRELPIEFLQRGKYQPRRDMSQDALQELADSIKAQGLMQPIVVRPIPQGKYEIIAGERRWRASQLAQLSTIPVIIKPVADEAAIAMSLIENIQREDLNPIEEAMALHRLQHEFELTQQEVAEAVGKSRSTVTNLLRLMNLSQGVQTLLEHGDIEMGHARALLTLADREQHEIAKQIVSKGLSVRQTESLVRSLQQPQSKSVNSARDPNVQRLENELSDQLGAVVNLKHNTKGKGRLEIKYNSLDELDGILEKINIAQ